jgi:hypothetical protein
VKVNWHLGVLCGCVPVLATLPADALELSGGVSLAGIQIGIRPSFAASPFVGVLWRSEGGFLFEAHHMLSIVPGPNVGVYDRTAVGLGHAWNSAKLSLGPSISVLSMPVCAEVICDRVEGVLPGGHVQIDWYLLGPLGVSVSANVDWLVGGSRVVSEGPVVMLTAGPVLRLEVQSK